MILVDNYDAAAWPTQIESTLPQIVLPCRARRVITNLGQGRLPNVDQGQEFKMFGPNLVLAGR